MVDNEFSVPIYNNVDSDYRVNGVIGHAFIVSFHITGLRQFLMSISTAGLIMFCIYSIVLWADQCNTINNKNHMQI